MPNEQDAALAVVQSTSVPIHDIGTAAYLSPDIAGWAAEWGWSNPFAFYFAGRGGMLGEVGADVVTSALGWFAPSAVHAMYSEGIGVAGATGAAARMAEAHGKWGEKHYGEVEGLEEIVAVTEELVDGLEGSALPLFVGWRDAARSDSPSGRAAQLMQILREWRGGNHLVATTAVGLSPLEAILTNEGPGQAKFFGWPEPFPDICRHKAAARRGGGDHRPAVRIGPGRCTRRSEVLGLRGRGRDAARRHPVGPPGPFPGEGRKPGPARVKGCSAAGLVRTEERVITTDLWCSSECTPPCQGGGRGFKSRQVRRRALTRLRAVGARLPGRVAQLVERAPEKREVTGSTPVPTTGKPPPRGRIRGAIGSWERSFVVSAGPPGLSTSSEFASRDLSHRLVSRAMGFATQPAPFGLQSAAGGRVCGSTTGHDVRLPMPTHRTGAGTARWPKPARSRARTPAPFASGSCRTTVHCRRGRNPRSGTACPHPDHAG